MLKCLLSRPSTRLVTTLCRPSSGAPLPVRSLGKRLAPLSVPSRGAVFEAFNKQHPPQISSSDLAARGLGPKDAIIDVRPDVEREQLGALREYIAIDLEEILDDETDFSDRLPGGTVYILCRSGRRSNIAASVLRNIGVDAWNIRDGILGFQENSIDHVPRREE